MFFAGRFYRNLLWIIYDQHLTFRDEVDVNSCGSFVLVDHHVSPFDLQKVAMVFDHRPRDPTVVFSPNCSVNIAEVGSCATLVANYILKASAKIPDVEKAVLKLLYGKAHLIQ